MMQTNILCNEDNIDGMKTIPDNSIDCILTDPPYKYLKHKLDRDFNEEIFFLECKRVLKSDGFIILFGRGTSFYRWNVLLDELDFTFKEEIIWNKRRISSPALKLGRVHESISIHTKGNGSINHSVINYGELKGYDIDKIYEDLKRLGGLFNKGAAFEKVASNLKKIQNGEDYSNGTNVGGHKHTFSSVNFNRCVSTYTIDAIEKGCREQSIISDSAQHYGNLHPTQKPVRLLERLLFLVTKECDVVLDPFAGSCSTAIASMNTNRKFICYEIDKEYYQSGLERINKHRAATHNIFNSMAA